MKFKKKILICLSIVFFLSLIFAGFAQAVDFVPSVGIPIPGSDFKAGVTSTAEGNLAGRYIASLYKFFVGIAGILAVFMIALGGVLWLFSGGSSEKISKAKETIVGAITGLLLALGSYLILYTINPDLVNFTFKVNPVTDTTDITEEVNLGCCLYQGLYNDSNTCSEITEADCNDITKDSNNFLIQFKAGYRCAISGDNKNWYCLSPAGRQF
jgi:hypothetical protein